MCCMMLVVFWVNIRLQISALFFIREAVNVSISGVNVSPVRIAVVFCWVFVVCHSVSRGAWWGFSTYLLAFSGLWGGRNGGFPPTDIYFSSCGRRRAAAHNLHFPPPAAGGRGTSVPRAAGERNTMPPPAAGGRGTSVPRAVGERPPTTTRPRHDHDTTDTRPTHIKFATVILYGGLKPPRPAYIYGGIFVVATPVLHL